MDKIKGLSLNHVCSSQDGHILCRVDFGWQIKGSFPKIMFLLKSQDGHILCRINLEWTKYRGVISWSGYMYYSLSEYISHHLKR